MSQESLTCWDIGHPWNYWHDADTQGGGWERILRCDRCGTKRAENLDRYARRKPGSKPRYRERPKDYRVAVEGVTVADARAAIRLRLRRGL